MSRQGPPVGLIIAVVAVTAAALLFWLIMKSGDEDASASPGQPVAGSAPAPRISPVRRGDDRPGLPQVAPSEEGRRRASDDRPPPTETVINGVRVRDHRKDRTQPIEIPTGTRPAYARKIPPELTADISNRILPVVRECASNVPREARGDKPRATGQLVIAIKDQRVQIRQATIELADVVGAALEPTKQCIEQKALGVTAPADGEADLQDYSLRLSYALP